MLSDLASLSQAVGDILLSYNHKLVVAESCTGGWMAQAITETPGCSAWFDRGLVTYSNQAKIDLLDVNPTIIDQFGAVSKETVTEMVQGALKHSQAHCAVAVTGIAGPDGGSGDKPVGTVYLAWLGMHRVVKVDRFVFEGNRHAIRRQSVVAGLFGVIAMYSSD